MTYSPAVPLLLDRHATALPAALLAVAVTVVPSRAEEPLTSGTA
eukprot:CAMPEP_0205919900 /NCGR_PEP_ID=MMETSP1325-20131115/10733_1 /ASSEMBLY_ACC=CAM_ASM_000708 /TAXON_ID=236786 /ORGANISM="Florenciella sp., Strain RCC1007" /LENGTH=43 /DNA_ID= /DNA_START= /DNA_END= /DNA_ORIENTATION=